MKNYFDGGRLDDALLLGMIIYIFTELANLNHSKKTHGLNLRLMLSKSREVCNGDKTKY